MNFKMKFMARQYGLNVLSYAYSCTAFVIFYVWLRDKKFLVYGERIYPHANFHNISDLQEVTIHHQENDIQPLYYWLAVALILDYVIRRLLQKNLKKIL